MTNDKQDADPATTEKAGILVDPANRLPRAEPKAVNYLQMTSNGSDVEVSIDTLLKLTPPTGHSLVRKAYEFAERLHRGQFRKSGRPYIHHPLTVAHYLAELNLDSATIAAGLLHDVLEDTDMTLEHLAELFPEPVPQIVQGVTKISRMNFSTTREAQVENLRIMILAMAQDIRVVIVKLCDRLHNMKTLEYLSPDRRIAISQETLDIFAPLANRLGIATVKTDMEDLAMRWLHPEAYQELIDRITHKRKERQELVEESIDFLRHYLGLHFSSLIITGRPKHFWSIYNKMKLQNLSFDQIHDLNALRVICAEESQCYEILGLIHQIWPAMPGRFKDYISTPKKNLYRSIHTTVIGLNGAITEIQIRTREMHEIAEYGIAAHWAYKEGNEIQNDERLAWLRQLTEWITDPNEPEGMLEALKKDVFADRVLCFTPKGDVVELPANATPIDFAYSIHTKVGEQCVGAKINGRMVNLRTPLRNGDIVEILTSNTGHPSRDWLEYVVTGRARSKIKHWLKARNVDEWVDQGRKALLRILQERGHHVRSQELETEMQKVLPAYKMQTVADLLVEVGFGSISPHAVLARAKPDWATKPVAPKKTTASKPKKSPGVVSIMGTEGAATRTSNCCLPIPGDRIVAYVTRGRGVSIHRKDCPNVVRALKDPEEKDRILPASWSGDGSTTYSATIHIECEDRNGLLNDISGVISAKGIFIKACQTRSDTRKNKALLVFELTVRDADQLEQVLNEIRRQRGVIDASRRFRGMRNGHF